MSHPAALEGEVGTMQPMDTSQNVVSGISEAFSDSGAYLDRLSESRSKFPLSNLGATPTQRLPQLPQTPCMASNTIIPEPREDGCYSDSLGARYERFFIEDIQRAAPPKIDSTNAGELLFLIWNEAVKFTNLPNRPPQFSTRSLCDEYVGRDPNRVALLAAVHEKKAYAWLCTDLARRTPPNSPAGLPADASLPFHHTPPKTSEDFDVMIDEFLTKHRPRMRELVKKANDVPSLLPSWKFESSEDENLARHISGLRIPIASNGQPSFLLHDLGEDKNNLDRERIPNVFSLAYHTLLINTSGSGKTRLLLEGLCERWGFYFVAKPDMAGIGSADFWRVITELDSARDYSRAKDRKKRDPEDKTAVEHMQKVAERRLFQLLLARFLLLNLLVDVARELPGGLQPKEHRRLWVLLQAQPRIFGGDLENDIFTILTGLLQHANDLKHRIYNQYEKLSDLKQKIHDPDTGQDTELPFFCVLDEAQITATPRMGEFMSDDNLTERPILRQIWLSWSMVLTCDQMRLVLSGTGIQVQALEDTLASAAGKPKPYRTKTDIGAFEDPEAQAEYIQRYVPAQWSDPAWTELLTRAWAWLRGRYRSTATLISLILMVGYQCPHRTLDEYVEVFTGFRPMDGKGWADGEPPLPPDANIQEMVTKLNFRGMNDTQALTLSYAIYDQILYGRYTLSSFTSEQRAAFVKYGFARHKKGTDDTVLDEPLAILAALRWVNQKARLSLFEYLRRDIQKYSKRQNGFEAYLAFHLRKRFESSPKLSEVFTLRSDFCGTDVAWQHEEFELVTVVATTDRNKPHVSVVTPSCGSSSNVGFLARTGEEALDWISTNGDRFTFCFPPESFGPDLLFFVRSKVSGNLLLVMIQAKKYDNVAKQVLIHRVRTVTPSWFWKSKDMRYPTADAAPFITNNGNNCVELATRTKDVLANIPLGLKAKGADYPVLRVFASWPGGANLERTLEWKEEPWHSTRAKNGTSSPRRTVKRKSSGDNIEDPDLHPLATLDLEDFNQFGEELDLNWFRGDVEQRLVVPSKRRREEDPIEEPSRVAKRQRLERHYERADA